VFIIGHLRGTSRPKVFPIRESNREDNAESELCDRCKLLEGDELETIQEKKEKANRIRRLTPTECERLQGFPDGWTKYGTEEVPEDVLSVYPYNKKRLEELKKDNTFGQFWLGGYPIVEISDTQRYKTLGNAVTVNVIREIMSELLTSLNQNKMIGIKKMKKYKNPIPA